MSDVINKTLHIGHYWNGRVQVHVKRHVDLCLFFENIYIWPCKVP